MRSLFFLLATPMYAQGTATIRGEVFQSDSTTRASGIVIIALDSTGAEASRALSGQSGTFSMTVQAPATYSLRALRIGYRPTALTSVTVAAGEVRVIRAILSGSAVTLNLVRVEGRGTCRISTETGVMVATLWDQARTGLMASTMSAGGRPFDATLATYNQYTPRGSRTIAAETLKVVQKRTTTGFVSQPAELLAATGYVTVIGSQISYHAPDANALLSPSFAELHCFDVKLGGTAHPDWIGIAFRPAARRGAIADIEGTLWLDRASSELRRLEYKYVNTPRNTASQDADGNVSFLKLLTGDWIISRWAIRTPVTEEVAGMGRATRFNAIGTRVVGGMTALVRQDGIEFYRNPGASITIQVRARDSVNTASHAYAGLAGTGADARADSTGRVTITGLVEGRYRAVVISEFANWVGARPVERDVDVSFEEVREVDMTLPRASDAIQYACGTRGRLVYGNLRDAAGNAVLGGVVLFDWTQVISMGDRRAAPRVQEYSRTADTDSQGRWHLCLPANAAPTVSVVSGGNVLLKRPLFQIGKTRDGAIDLVLP